MRLSTNYNKVNIITSSLVLVCTGIIYYLVIHSILTDKLDRDLTVEENEIRQYTKEYGKLPLPAAFIDQQIIYSDFKQGEVEREFSYTNYYNPKEKETEPGRRLVTTVSLRDKVYRVTIIKSRMEAEDLVRVILLITLSVTLILLVALLLINRFFFNRLWKPFYVLLARMKSFEVTRMAGIREEPTKIDEFIELNASVNAMVEKVQKDYKELKSFTDNASHEMNTPLAVITSKLDSLLQTEEFTEKQGTLLQDIYHATGRLSRLHQSLLLLAKIENNLIPDIQEIALDKLVITKVKHFQELFYKNKLEVKYEVEPLKVVMSKYLVDILLNNLLSNAVRHNIEGGKITIQLKGDLLTVSNTGNPIHIDGHLFDRFSKSAQSEGMGLGLAITKQICNLYSFRIHHHFSNGEHSFIIQLVAVQ